MFHSSLTAFTIASNQMSNSFGFAPILRNENVMYKRTFYYVCPSLHASTVTFELWNFTCWHDIPIIAVSDTLSLSLPLYWDSQIQRTIAEI